MVNFITHYNNFVEQNDEAQKLKIDKMQESLRYYDIDESFASKYYEELDFLFKFSLFYKIIGFKNSTASGSYFHNIIEIEENGQKCLAIRFNHIYKSINSFKDDFSYDAKDDLITHKGTNIECIYSGTRGLIPKPSTLESVGKLSVYGRKILLENAQSFHKNLTPRQKEKLTCVLQIVTNPRNILSSRFFKNINTLRGNHGAIRIIHDDKSVYSTGVTVLKSSPGIVSKKAGCRDLDGDELCSHDGRLTTSIAISPDKADKIIQLSNSFRDHSYNFNFFSNNCVSFCSEALKIAGEEVNIKVPLTRLLWNILPSREDIFSYVPGMNSLYDRFVWLKDAITPHFVKKIFSLLGRKLFNLLPTVYIHHPAAMIHWMLEQKSTYVRRDNYEPDMLILPPEDPKQYSNSKLEELKELYKNY